MNKYEETGKRPKGQFDDYYKMILRARNRGWTCGRISKYINSVYGVDFKVTTLGAFCCRAFKLVDSYSAYSPEDAVKWNVSGLQLLEATS